MTKGKWISVKQRLPEKPGQYVVTYKIMADKIRLIRVARFTDCLEGIDQWDLADKKYPGFYMYSSDYGFYEVTDVDYWLMVPEVPDGLPLYGEEEDEEEEEEEDIELEEEEEDNVE